MAVSLKTKANLIGIGALVIVAGYIAHDLTYTESVKPCSQDYPSPVSVNLKDNDGDVLTPTALQARSSAQDWGLLEKLQIERDTTAPAPITMKVKLPADDIAYASNLENGIGFPWRPSRLDRASAVCFSYAVKFSDTFDFSTSGLLPGLVASPDVIVSAPQDQFEDKVVEEESVPLRAHIGWSETGNMRVMTFDPTNERRNMKKVVASEAKFGRGRWHRVEAEINLENAGKADGLLRLWLDGSLVLERQSLRLRPKPGQAFDSVLYHLTYGTPFGSGSSSPTGDGVIKVTPLELSWR